MASIYRNKRGVWMIAYYPIPHRRKIITGCRDYKATKALADKLEAEAFMRRRGVIDPKADGYAKAQAAPLMVEDGEGRIVGGHLADFRAALIAKGVSARQATELPRKVARVLGLAKAERIGDLAPSAVQRAIGALRDKGLSLQTCNHLLAAVKQFAKWLWRDGRAADNPLAHLSGFNVRLDRRHDRRALSVDETRWLLDTTRSGPERFGVSGPERRLLYKLAVETALRRGELASLTRASFTFGEEPTVAVEAAYSKHRKRDVLPLRPDTAAELQGFLTAKLPDAPAFRLPDKPAVMLRADLQAAREAWLQDAPTPDQSESRGASGDFLAYCDSSGRYLDFHALRHSAATLLAATGAHPKTLQTLLRHSDVRLTLGVYAHSFGAEAAAVAALPDLGAPPRSRRASEKATGTDDAQAVEASHGFAGCPRPNDQ